MNLVPQLLLVLAVAGVGVLHTVVPDHWVPIALIARQRGWTRRETARAALVAGTGHVVSTLIIALIVWIAGAVVATRFGQWIDTISSVALIAFGGWIAIGAWRDLHGGGDAHSHGHNHGAHSHADDGDHGDNFPGLDEDIHGPELATIATDAGPVLLSIYENGVPPRFRLTGAAPASVETIRPDGSRQVFPFVARGAFYESIDEIPEPHGFDVLVTIAHGEHAHRYRTAFAEHSHSHDDDHTYGAGHGHHHHHVIPRDGEDALYAPLPGDTAVLTHVHAHRHGGVAGASHLHRHDHAAASTHAVAADVADNPPPHDHRHRTSARTALLLIVGSSPMIEGIPAFFAASRYGFGLIVAMSAVFALSTIATYVVLCVASTAGLQRLRLGAVERYGEVLSGLFIAAVGLVFWVWPVL